jgi:hypothetical protein
MTPWMMLVHRVNTFQALQLKREKRKFGSYLLKVFVSSKKMK